MTNAYKLRKSSNKIPSIRTPQPNTRNAAQLHVMTMNNDYIFKRSAHRITHDTSIANYPLQKVRINLLPGRCG